MHSNDETTRKTMVLRLAANAQPKPKVPKPFDIEKAIRENTMLPHPAKEQPQSGN